MELFDEPLKDFYSQYGVVIVVISIIRIVNQSNKNFKSDLGLTCELEAIIVIITPTKFKVIAKSVAQIKY